LSPLKLTPPRSIAGASIGETFYWQPCDNFDMGTETSVGCVQETAGGYFPIGTNTDGTTASGISNDGKAQFIMIAADGLRLMTLACNCDETQEFVAAYKGETPPTNPGDPIGYGFDLTSKYCCPSTGPPPTAPPGPDGPGGSTGVSTGTIVTIGFFAIVIVYVAAGITFQKTRRQATGRELMPNIGFWGSLPGLVWDGMKFAFSCGKATGYQSV